MLLLCLEICEEKHLPVFQNTLNDAGSSIDSRANGLLRVIKLRVEWGCSVFNRVYTFYGIIKSAFLIVDGKESSSRKKARSGHTPR
jgi:hypothetical protein